MNADARHGGLRPKRGLPAKLHFENRPTTDSTQRSERPDYACRFVLQVFPKSRRTIVTASKRANSRFFTNCYPISAVFAPKVNQIATRVGMNLAPSSHHKIHNESFNISCLKTVLRGLPSPKKEGPGQISR